MPVKSRCSCFYFTCPSCRFENMQLWLENVPANVPKHLCYGMSLKNLNSFRIEVNAYHVSCTFCHCESHCSLNLACCVNRQISNMDQPQHVTSLGPSELLKLPTYKRRTAYEIFKVTETGKNSASRNSAKSKRALYSFIYDPEEHGSSSVIRLRTQNPTFSACHEYANGQFRPESSNVPLEFYSNYQQMLESENL